MFKSRRLAAMAAALALAPTALLGYDVPKDLTIKRPEKNPPIIDWAPQVQFSHGKHAVYTACGTCHHEESDRNVGEFLKCTQCHNKPGVDDNKTSFYLAWHNDSQHSCLGCHRQARLAGKDTPPLSCTDGCHKKQ